MTLCRVMPECDDTDAYDDICLTFDIIFLFSIRKMALSITEKESA